MVLYEDIKNEFEIEGCTLLTTKEEMQIQNLQTTSKYKIIASCGHEIDGCWFHMFKYRGTGKICKSCMDKKQSIHNKTLTEIHIGESPYTTSIEKQGIDLIKKYASDKLHVEVSPECCLADIAIKDIEINDDKWIPLQLKCTLIGRHNIYSFGFSGTNYNDMYILFICVNEEKFWVISGNDVADQKKVSIGMKKSKYDQFAVDKSALGTKLLELYNNDINKIPLSNIQLPITKNCQKEQEFKRLREEKLHSISFVQPESGYNVYDFKLNGFKVQEKIAYYLKNNLYVCLHKRNKGKKNQPYNDGDNDFYWIHCPNKKYFYVFPNDVLVEKKMIIKDSSKNINKNLSFYKNPWTNIYKYNYDDNDICEKISQLFIS